jgi:cytochrome bd-type quinol oxidase subunit 2
VKNERAGERTRIENAAHADWMGGGSRILDGVLGPVGPWDQLQSAGATLASRPYGKAWMALEAKRIETAPRAWPNIILTAPVPIAVAAVTALLLRALMNKYDYQPFFLSLALFALSYAGLGISIYPFIVPQSITTWQAAAPENSQIFLLFGVSVLLPLILGYTAWAYWVFRGQPGSNGFTPVPDARLWNS